MEYVVQYLWLIPALPLVMAGLGALLQARPAAAGGFAGHWRDGCFLAAFVRRVFRPA